jgi:hypothetical protein
MCKTYHAKALKKSSKQQECCLFIRRGTKQNQNAMITLRTIRENI